MYTQVKIVNRLTDEPVQGPDEQGEICIKSPQCFKGYLNENDAKIFDQDGYFHTGDLGYYDAQVLFSLFFKNNFNIRFIGCGVLY